MALSIEEYRSARAALIEEDSRLHIGRPALGNYSELERAAIAAINRIREEDNHAVWSRHGDDVYMGMPFLQGRKFIEQTRLFKLLRQMPKGALLHAHFDATCDATFLLRTALKFTNICIAYAPSNFMQNHHVVTFKALPQDHESLHSKPKLSLLDQKYTPGSFIPLHSAREAHPEGVEAFDVWVTSKLRLPEPEPGQTIPLSMIWPLFASCFVSLRGLLEYEPILHEYTMQLLRSSVADGISYLEVRINCFYWNLVAANGTDLLDHHAWLAMFRSCLSEFKTELEAEDRQSSFHGLKIIYTTLRVVPGSQCLGKAFGKDEKPLKDYMDDCLSLAQAYPDLVCGFDLVGHEDEGHTLLSYLPDLLYFQQRQKELGFDIPFIFHAGETLHDGSAVDQNLFDAILLGTKRIGHGFSLVKHPHLMELCKQKDILIETCPISNELLKYTNSVQTHPFPILLNHGVPVALSCDDPAIFMNSGLTYDFYQALAASDGLNIVRLGELARLSIKHSCLDTQQRRECLKDFEMAFRTFLTLLADSD